MSVLDTPRIMFRGRITWDPIVTNNYPKFYSEDDCEPVWPPTDPVTKFREEAVDAALTGGNWNPHGTHRATFYETTIASVDCGAGPSTSDSFVGRPVALQGMLVDLEPYGSVSSQFFFDLMSFGIDGGCRVLAPRRTRMTARYINFARNLSYKYIAGVASVMWQTSFAKADGLQIDAHDSAILAALQRALADDDALGLTVRWNAYRTIYYDNENIMDRAVAAREAAALHQKLVGGGFQPNPARSELVGALGIWRRGEATAVPGDRLLQSVETAKIPLGSAFARLASGRLTIDLSNSVPETDLTLTKKDLGPLTVVAVDPTHNAPEVVLGTLTYADYDRTAYDRSAGIVSLPLDAAQASVAAGRDLVVRGADGGEYLHERPLLACPDEPNVYLDEGDVRHVQVRIFERGVAPGRPIELTVQGDASSAQPFTVESDPQGLAEVPFTGLGGNVEGFLLVSGAGSVIPAGIDTQVTDYMYVRTLPADASVAAAAPTWDNVYTMVLRNWHAMAPCMDNWLRLGDREQVAAYGPLVRRLTARDNFESFRCMPVTRDLTAGQRMLLYRWLDDPQPVAGVAEAGPPKPAEGVRSPRKKSRSLRRP